jgi:hypothetical protein
VIQSSGTSDRAAIAGAAFCAAHCLLAPIIASWTQVAHGFASEQAEHVLLTGSLVMSGTVLVGSCLRRRARRGAVGAFLLGASLLVWVRSSAAWTEPVEQLLVTAGAAMIVVAHVINLRCCTCQEEGPRCATVE